LISQAQALLGTRCRAFKSFSAGQHPGQWSRIVVPQPEGVRAAAAITRSNAQKGILTIVNVNNHYEGSAPP